jgi:LacI family transcriptional regulator
MAGIVIGSSISLPPRNSSSFRDVAKRAKVSAASVSRVARGNPNVHTDIRARVLKAARELGVDIEDRTQARTSVVAFLLSNRDVLHSFQARVLLGAERYCASQSRELLFMSFHYSAGTAPKDLPLPQVLSQGGLVRAVILGGKNYGNLLTALHQRKIPFSVLGNNVVGPWSGEREDCVYSDDIQGAHDLTLKFIADGHRDVWFIGDTDLPWYERCARGYQRAMRSAGLEPRLSQIHSDDVRLGYLAMRSILSRHEPVSAVFAGSDQIARGVYDALHQAGLKVPDDIGVAGFNDSEAELLSPRLTSVREFPDELGMHLAEFALRRLDSPEMAPQELTIPTKVIVRESTGARREANQQVPQGEKCDTA